MIDIFVIRDPGDKRGPDVIDPLISTIAVALERGRIEIDKASDLQPMSVRALYISGIMLGDIVEIHDAYQGRSWKGKVTGIRHSLQGNVVFTELDVLRPNEFISI